jgi:hypothetical protein
MRFAHATLLALAACGRTSGRLASCSAGASSKPPSADTRTATVDVGPDVDAALALRATNLGASLGPQFTVLVEPPFVVAGDGPLTGVRREARDTLRWAVTKLKQDFFERDPSVPIDVYLFHDKASYETNTSSIFHEKPISRFGYYSADHHALIMNIATGGGTLVHELVHPFMVANFPDCPTWFNEGLASLFERPTEVDGHIEGLPNWRLPILQSAIRDHHTLPIKELFALGSGAFYGDGSDVHYAEARYLLYWTQLKGELVPFYRAFVAHHGDDPTGYGTFQRVLEEKDMAAFQRRWEAWALELEVED